VPTFNMFQSPTRWMIWDVFSLSLLAGMGAEGWRRPNGWSLYWTRLATMGAVAVSIGAGLAWHIMGDVSPTFIRATAILGVLGLGAGILSLTAPPRSQEEENGFYCLQKDEERTESKDPITSPWRKILFQFKPPSSEKRTSQENYPILIWQWAVALFIAIDLCVMNWGLIPAEELSLYEPSPTAGEVSDLSNGGRLFLSRNSEYWLKYVRFLRFDTFQPDENWKNLRATLLPNSNMLDNIASTSNFDPLTPARFADWMEMLDEASPESYQKMLQMMNVGVVEMLSSNRPYGIRFEQENGRWFYWATCPRAVKDPSEARKLIIDGGIDFNKEVILEGFTETTPNECKTQEFNAVESTSRYLEISDASNPNRINIRVSTDHPAWLVLSEVWYPGWQARLDGKPISILRANYLFRAVHIPRGNHELTFIYKPLSFWVGCALTSISSIILFFFTRKRYASE
jgi:hypothetical protein